MVGHRCIFLIRITSNAKALDPRLQVRYSYENPPSYPNRILSPKTKNNLYVPKEKAKVIQNDKLLQGPDSVLYRMPSPDKIH